MFVKQLLFLALSLFFLVAGKPAAGVEYGPTLNEDLWLRGRQFAAGSGIGYVVTAGGLAMAETAVITSYLSPVLDAPIAFNAVVPQWIADVPEGTEMFLSLRTGNEDGRWSEWFEVHEQPDWSRPEDVDTVGDMVLVPPPDERHDRVQFAITFTREMTLVTPRLRQMRLTFIDSTSGPTAAELVAMQMALTPSGDTPAGGYPKPLVVGRDVWCTHADCDCTTNCSQCIIDNPLEYEPVTHLIFHHTVSDNNYSGDWAAIVRAIYTFHAHSRCWGDIGYNYLVDRNGVLYEGHRGGDDVIGTHAAGANAGTMALSLIGTFVTVEPPQPMLDSAIELFAWKADEKDIDLYDSSTLPNMDWGLPHFMGHRDVYGTTECPGEMAHDLQPYLRDSIAAEIGQVPAYIFVDELSPAFTKSNANWYDGDYSCGFNVHAWYTFSTTDPGASTNWADWRPDIAIAGPYEVDALVPFCATGDSETDGATYTITHAYGTSAAVVSHEDNLGLWVNLGTFDFNAGNSGVIHLTDLTTTDSLKAVWFDAIRLRYLEYVPDPLVINDEPLPSVWHTSRTITFRWHTENIVSYNSGTLTVATDPVFTNVVLSQPLGAGATTYTHTFGQDYTKLYWKVALNASQNGTVTSAVTNFQLDATAPTSSVHGVYQLTNGLYALSWSGIDLTAGVSHYTVDYRQQGGSWTPLLVNTAATGALFTPPQPGMTYCFRSQGVDVAGNVEPLHAGDDICTSAAVYLGNPYYFPLVQR